MMDLQHLTGKKVSRIRRVYYVHHGRVHAQEGALELRFQDDFFLLLDIHSDWTLRVAQEEWADPFAPLLTRETSEYIRENGKWSAFDRSDTVPACYFLGRAVTTFQEIRNEVDELIGAVLEFGKVAIKAYSYGGEIRVEWNSPAFIGCDLLYSLPPE